MPLTFVYCPLVFNRSPFPHPTLPSHRNPVRRKRRWFCCENANASDVYIERSATFSKGARFYREESQIARDLGVLAAVVLAQKYLLRPLRVLDVCSGTGVRALRYLSESPTDFVLANDPQTTDDMLERNLASFINKEKAAVTKDLARDCFRRMALRNRLWDIVDWDGFGSGGSPGVGEALEAVNPDGLVYITATDSVSAAGRNSDVTLAAYGAVAARNPFVNEQMLRLVVGTAVREAAARGLYAKPLLSYFLPSSSKAQVLLRVHKGKPPPKYLSRLGFVIHCKECLQITTVPIGALMNIQCCSCRTKSRDALTLSGPLWLGRLQFKDFLEDIRAEATHRKWLQVESLLKVLDNENRFGPGFYSLGAIASRAGVQTPPRRLIQQELHNMGFSSTRSHVAARTIKTNARTPDLLRAVRKASQIFKEQYDMNVESMSLDQTESYLSRDREKHDNTADISEEQGILSSGPRV